MVADGLDAAEAGVALGGEHHTLPSVVVEVTGHGDDSMADAAAQVRLRLVLQLRDEDADEVRHSEIFHLDMAVLLLLLLVRCCLHPDGGPCPPLGKLVRHKLHRSLHHRALQPAIENSPSDDDAKNCLRKERRTELINQQAQGRGVLAFDL